MFSDTGTTPFILYGIFIGIALIGSVVLIIFIKNGLVDPNKLTAITDIFKWAVATAGISTVTLIVANLYKERDQDIKEAEYFDKYVSDVKNIKGFKERLRLVKYLSIVSPGGDIKRAWRAYYDSIRIELPEYDSLVREKNKFTKPTEASNIQEQIDFFDSPLSSR